MAIEGANGGKSLTGSLKAAAEAARKAAEEAARKAAEEAARKAAEAAAKKAAEQQAKQLAEQQAQASTNNTTRLSSTAQADYGQLPFEPTPQPAAESAQPLSPDQEMQMIKAAVRENIAVQTEYKEAAGITKDAPTGELDSVDSGNTTLEEQRASAADGDDRSKRALARREQNIAQAREALPEDQRAKYDAVRASAEASGVKNAGDAVDDLLLQGKLTPELLGELDQLNSVPLAPVVEAVPNARAQLVGEIVTQIAHPETIQQDPAFNTCAEAAMERKLASENPAEYTRALRMTVAADPNSVYTMPGSGVPVHLTMHQAHSADQSTRSLTSTIYQQSVHASFRQGYDHEPLTRAEFDAAWNAQFPGDGKLRTFTSEHAGAAMNELGPGSTAVLETASGDSTQHAVTVDAVSETTVTFTDPYGERHKVPREEFEAMLRGAVLPETSAVPDTGVPLQIGGGRYRPSTSSSTGEF